MFVPFTVPLPRRWRRQGGREKYAPAVAWGARESRGAGTRAEEGRPGAAAIGDAEVDVQRLPGLEPLDGEASRPAVRGQGGRERDLLVGLGADRDGAVHDPP